MDEKLETIASWLGTGSINIFGMPFAGKDTQAEKLAEFFGGAMISSGEVFRHYKDNPKLQKIMAEGGIPPIDIFEELIVPYLTRDELKGKPLILSEVGLQEGEQQVIIEACNASGHPQKAVVYLRLSNEEVYRRFDESQQNQSRGNRQDDDRSVLGERISNYERKVVPVIDYYREQGALVEVDGTKSREQVTEEIIDDLYGRAIIDA